MRLHFCMHYLLDCISNSYSQDSWAAAQQQLCHSISYIMDWMASHRGLCDRTNQPNDQTGGKP